MVQGELSDVVGNSYRTGSGPTGEPANTDRPKPNPESTDMNRRGFLGKLGTYLAAGAVIASGIDAVLPKSAYAESSSSSAQSSQISDSYISKMMDLGSVEDILKGTNVTNVERKGNSTNFKELVYESDMPSLVLYDNSTVPDHNGASRRSAIIFKELAKQYEGQINFVSYDISKDPTQSGNYGGKDATKENIKSLPSIGMYSIDNSGDVTQIDILRGGPDEDKYINNMVNNLNGYWISGNLFNQDNPDGDGKVYRLNNTFKDWKVTGHIKQ